MRRKIQCQRHQCRDFLAAKQCRVIQGIDETRFGSDEAQLASYDQLELDKGNLRFIIPFASTVHEIAEEDGHFGTKDVVYEAPISFHVEIGVELTEFEKDACSQVCVLVDQLGISDQCYSIWMR
jgi:hypothetical protein